MMTLGLFLSSFGAFNDFRSMYRWPLQDRIKNRLTFTSPSTDSLYSIRSNLRLHPSSHSLGLTRDKSQSLPERDGNRSCPPAGVEKEEDRRPKESDRRIHGSWVVHTWDTWYQGHVVPWDTHGSFRRWPPGSYWTFLIRLRPRRIPKVVFAHTKRDDPTRVETTRHSRFLLIPQTLPTNQ